MYLLLLQILNDCIYIHALANVQCSYCEQIEFNLNVDAYIRKPNRIHISIVMHVHICGYLEYIEATNINIYQRNRNLYEMVKEITKKNSCIYEIVTQYILL